MDKSGGLRFNHAMIYTRAVGALLRFYKETLGFELIESMEGEYARLKSRGSDTTIAIHNFKSESPLHTGGGIRIYFEVPALYEFCTSLEEKGVEFMQRAEKMPWGWDHAYLKDPDGNEISLYSAGDLRLKKPD